MSDTTVAMQLDDDNPWPGLAQYTEASKDYFHGREQEVADLLRLVQQSPFVMLYGKSGLGKSSMLQAGAFPQLRDRRYLPVHLRLNYAEGADAPLNQTLARLMQEIALAGRDAPTPGPDEGLWAYLQRRERPIWTADNFPITPVLVFDQFEEVFSHGGSPEHVRQMLGDIADLVGNRLPSALADDAGAAERLNLQTQQYRVILSFRADFLAKVASWERQASLPKHEALDLEPMTREVAIQAVQTAGAAVLEPGVAEKIVDFVLARDEAAGSGSADEVEPVLLSLCCFQLNNRRERPAKIDAGLVEQAGQHILLDFYTDALAGTEPRVAVFIEDNLIQGSFRSSFARDEALARGALTADDLETLQKRRLLRVDEQGGVQRIELIHDRLVGIVRNAREARQARERAEAELQAAEQQAQEAQRAAALAQSLREGQRIRRWRNGLAVALGLLLVALGGVAYLAKQSSDFAEEARNLATESNERRLLALENADLATKNAASASAAAATASAAAAVAEDERRKAVVAAKEMDLQKTAADAARRRAEQAEASARANSHRAEALRLGVDSQAILAGVKAGSEEQAFQQLLAARLLWPDAQTAGPVFEALASRQHLASFKPLEVKTESDPIALAFSSDGKLLAVGHADGSLSLREAASPGKPIATAAGHGQMIQGVAISGDGRRIVTGSNDGTLRRWQVQPLRPEGEAMRGHEGRVYSVAISPDGSRIASAGRDGTVRLWDAASGAEMARASPAAPAGLFGVAFNPTDGATLAVVTAASEATKTSSLIVLDSATLAVKRPAFYAHSQSAFALAYSPSGRYVVTGGQDDIVRVRDLAGDVAAIVRMNSRGGGDLQTVAFSPNERWVAAGSTERSVRLWTAATGEPLGLPLTGYSDGVTSVIFSPRGDWLATGAEDGAMRLWPLDLSWTARNDGAAPADALGVAIGREGRRALFGLRNGALSLRDEGRETRVLPLTDRNPPAGPPLTGCSTAPAAATRQQASRSLDPLSPADRAASSAQAARVVALLNDGRTALSGHHDGTLRRWDLDAVVPVGAPLWASECALVALAASTDGRHIAVADEQGTVLLLDAAGKLIDKRLAGGRVTALALARDGRQIAVGGNEPSLKIYIAGQTQPATMAGVLEVPTSLVFGANEEVLFSGSSQGNVRLWEMARRMPMSAPQQASGGAVRALLVGADGSRFFSAGASGAARPWPAPSSWADLICKKISANPSRKSWREWVSTDLPYRCICPNLGIAPDDPATPAAQLLVCPSSVESLRQPGNALSGPSARPTARSP